MKPLLPHAIGLSAVLLSGCATPPAFQADWYIQEEKDKPDGIVLALLNHSQEMQEVSSLVVNSSERGIHTGWKMTLDPKVSLHPGLILLKPMDEFQRDGKPKEKWPDCTLPVKVIVLQGNAKVNVDIPVQLPSVLPRGWGLKECRAPPVK